MVTPAKAGVFLFSQYSSQELRMTDQTTDTTPEVDQAETEVRDTQNEQTEEQSQQQSVETVDQLPDWAQKLVGDLRKENAGHRKAKQKAEKDAEQAAQKAAEEQGEYKRLYEEEKTKREQAEQARQTAELAHLRAKIAGKHKLPAILADRLTGETEEELEADALDLLKALPSPTSTTDSADGINTSVPTPQLSDEDIREKAARLGVSFEHLKAHYATRSN